MNSTILVEKQRKERQFTEEVISPLADKIISDITSSKLSYKQTETLLRLVDERIKNMIIGS